MIKELEGANIHISGVVQGVGFRPFVYALATRLGLSGWVRNTSAGVDIRIDGSPEALAAFELALREQAPPLARIDSIQIQHRAPDGFTGFEIVDSESIPDAFQPVSSDVCICADCLRELFDPRDRRYRYPFINCTNCGPRFSIIQDIPYDRPKTTMAGFAMCPACAAEYSDPLDRRFHAQPVACPRCGPGIWLEARGERVSEQEDALQDARRILRQGGIVAIKGLGGFHLACNATSAEAVIELRRRKLRVDKPFAVMMPDLATVRAHCSLNDADIQLLTSRERPIVILTRRPESTIAAEVAPGQHTVGVMLPYTPLHYLLLADDDGRLPEDQSSSSRILGSSILSPQSSVLIMTSGNLSEEPIATDNDEARDRLQDLADAFLMNDRGIRTRCDDSVMRTFTLPPLKEGEVIDSPASTANKRARVSVYPLRRSRGYAPLPVYLPWQAAPLLATGAELKNTFCITRDRYAFLSQHIGDLENYETLRSFEDSVTHFERLFRVRPERIAYDLHPDYLATRYALARAAREGLPAYGVQHHHAHIAACMVENGVPVDERVIGVAFDGTGYGDDGAIWGGEFLLAGYGDYRRAFHLDYIPMPGGDAAVREPWRLALAWLDRAGIDSPDDLSPITCSSPVARRVVKRQLELALNSPQTSSMGRLFDAVASLAGIRQSVNYEAQAAIEFEALVDSDEKLAYPFEIRGGLVDPLSCIRAIVTDLHSAVPVAKIAARFHNGVAAMVHQVCRMVRESDGLNEVALSGGVWQNMTLLTRTLELLRLDGFVVYTHCQVPANDGGLALGQAAVALCRSQTPAHRVVSVGTPEKE